MLSISRVGSTALPSWATVQRYYQEIPPVSSELQRTTTTPLNWGSISLLAAPTTARGCLLALGWSAERERPWRCASVECSFLSRIGIPTRNRWTQSHARFHSWIMQLRASLPKWDRSYSSILICCDSHWWAKREKLQCFIKFGKDW